ncbi:MAG: YHS domain-containing protein [Propionicimonas sp.]|nr:YHS domain-containing protein [Propionicimonas sp.]
MTTTTECPVCGMPVDEQNPGATASFDAQTYLFCSESCRDEFLADPGRFVGNTGS